MEGKLKQKGFKPSVGPHSEIPSYIWKCLAQMREKAAKVLAAPKASLGCECEGFVATECEGFVATAASSRPSELGHGFEAERAIRSRE